MIREINSEEFFKIVELGKLINNNYNINQINSSENVFVYESLGKICGFIQVLSLYETLEIINIIVDKDFRKKGIASNLLNFVTDIYKPEHILLEVRDTNDAAINFYKKHGFVEIRIIKNYYKENDAIVMEKVLI